MKKRVLCLCLAVLFSVSLCACTQQMPVSPNAAQEAERKSPSSVNSALASLESVDYGGREFRIALYDKSVVFGSGSESTLDKKLAERNRLVEEKFNIRLTVSPVSEGDLYLNLLDAYQTGADVCDLVVAPQSYASLLNAHEMLLNVNTLPFTDYTKPYFNQSAMTAASLGAMTYEIIGDFTDTPTAAWALCYNQSLMEWFGFTDFVTLAKNGQWTWSLFNRYIQWFYKDMNGDRVMTDADRFGFASPADDETLCKIFWASSGMSFFDNQPPSLLQMNFDTPATQDMIAAMKYALETPGRYEATNGKTAQQLFLDGQSLFYICPVASLGFLQLQGLSVGMLPLPKLYAEQEHFSAYVDPLSQVSYVLNDCKDTDFTGRIVQALNAASQDLVRSVTLDVYTAFHLTGNAAANYFADMLDHRYYDPAFLLGDSFPQVAAASTQILTQVLFLKGDFRAVYDNQLVAFNATYVPQALHGKQT